MLGSIVQSTRSLYTKDFQESKYNQKAGVDNIVRCMLRLSPLVHKRYSLGSWEKFIRSLVSIAEDTCFYLVGNKEHLAFFLEIPVARYSFVETMAYGTFDAVQLSVLDDSVLSDRSLDYYLYGHTSMQFAHYKKHKEDADLLDDLYQFFYTIPASSSLTLSYRLSHIRKPSLWHKLLRRTVLHDYFATQIGYHLDTIDQDLRTMVHQTLPSLFTNFTQRGSVQLSPTPYTFSLDANQVANLIHFPRTTDPIAGFHYAAYKQLPYTLQQDGRGVSVGTSFYKRDEVDVTISPEALQRHMYIVGKTGTGKSTCIAHMLDQQVLRHDGVALLDPHGDLYDLCLQNIPSERLEDVVLFDMTMEDALPSLNLLEYTDEKEKHLLVSGIISVFYKLFAYSRGPRLEHILRNTLYAVIEYPDATLLSVQQMLTDASFRKKVLSFVHDEIILAFWKEEFGKRTLKQQQEAIGPITNKIGQLLSSEVVRKVFGIRNSSLDIAQVLNEGKILLINLSKGQLGEDVSNMVGSLLITKLQIEVMKRAKQEADKRRPFYLYIDEFQHFTTESFSTMLSEARKYKLGLILAHQYVSQLSDQVQQAIFGNVGTTMSFGLGYKDAELLSKHFGHKITPQDLQSLPNYVAYMTTLDHDGVIGPYSVQTHNIVVQYPEHKVLLAKMVAERDKVLKTEKVDTLDKKERVEEVMTNDSIPGTLSIGDICTGMIKLKFNYGVFVEYGEREGLLHKKEIQEKKWKKNYEEGQNITVIVKDFKEVGGKKKVVWTQKLV